MLNHDDYLAHKYEYLTRMNEYLQHVKNLSLEEITGTTPDYCFSKIQYETMKNFVDFNRYVGDIRRKAQEEHKPEMADKICFKNTP